LAKGEAEPLAHPPTHDAAPRCYRCRCLHRTRRQHDDDFPAQLHHDQTRQALLQGGVAGARQSDGSAPSPPLQLNHGRLPLVHHQGGATDNRRRGPVPQRGWTVPPACALPHEDVDSRCRCLCRQDCRLPLLPLLPPLWPRLYDEELSGRLRRGWCPRLRLRGAVGEGHWSDVGSCDEEGVLPSPRHARSAPRGFSSHWQRRR
jgi:hypothetical protein